MNRSAVLRRFALVPVAGGLVVAGLLAVDGAVARRSGGAAFDPLFAGPGSVCGPIGLGQPAVLKALVLAKTETAPFQPVPMQAAGGDVPLYKNLGPLAFKVSTRSGSAQAYFNQGIRLSFAFNHAEAQRAFQIAQKLDPDCAMCHWGEALVLGPNINVPMMPEANAPAVAALARAVALKDRSTARERALIEALEKRYVADAKADRAPLDAAYADAMKAAALPLPGRRHDPDVVCRGGDGYPAVGLLGSRRCDAEGPWRRVDARARDRAEAQPVAPRRRFICISMRSKHRRGPRGHCPSRTALARWCPVPGIWFTCRPTSTTGSACIANRWPRIGRRSRSTRTTSSRRRLIRSTRRPTTRTTSIS
jgi:hypothetical protein